MGSLKPQEGIGQLLYNRSWWKLIVYPRITGLQLYSRTQSPRYAPVYTKQPNWSPYPLCRHVRSRAASSILSESPPRGAGWEELHLLWISHRPNEQWISTGWNTCLVTEGNLYKARKFHANAIKENSRQPVLRLNLLSFLQVQKKTLGPAFGLRHIKDLCPTLRENLLS